MKRRQFEKATYCMIPNINMWHSGKGKSIEKVIVSDCQEVGGVELVDHLGIFKDFETVQICYCNGAFSKIHKTL